MQKIGELIFSSTIFLVACALYYVASTFPDYQKTDQVGPALWPKMILLIILILSGILTAKNGNRLLSGIRSSEGSAPGPRVNRMLIAAVALSLAYVFIVSYAGFLVSIFLFQIIFLRILRVRNPVTLILYPVCLTFIVYAVFIRLLYIPLPKGSGIFLSISHFFY
ncbi:MAG: tripartite tricarboxylate transporter TctB family protein [Desulfobacteraceae bacterium]|nr:MAG: tripartite tricarboxylate transporter TctB family protein [Desulfobacteraceae bacterium]